MRCERNENATMDVTRNDKIRNEHIQVTTRVTQAAKNITERRLNWYEHERERDEEPILRKVLRTEIKMERRIPTRLERYYAESDYW